MMVVLKWNNPWFLSWTADYKMPCVGKVDLSKPIQDFYDETLERNMVKLWVHNLDIQQPENQGSVFSKSRSQKEFEETINTSVECIVPQNWIWSHGEGTWSKFSRMWLVSDPTFMHESNIILENPIIRNYRQIGMILEKYQMEKRYVISLLGDVEEFVKKVNSSGLFKREVENVSGLLKTVASLTQKKEDEEEKSHK